jgi:hypothetical protein
MVRDICRDTAALLRDIAVEEKEEGRELSTI